MWWLIIPAAILVFLAVIIIRALAFKPRELERSAPGEANIDGAHAIESLAEMIRCKTVSYKDASLIDETEFEKFRELLRTRYPRINAAAELTRIGKSGVLYKLPGEHSDKPSVFMAHYDVVPPREEAWDKPAFDGIIEDGVLWGRGTLDTKGTLCGVMESAEALLGEGFRPEQDIYLAFAGDEEVAGTTAPEMVCWFEERGIVPALVVDEGGAVVENVFPGVTAPCALIGIAEKGMLGVRLSIDGAGGHASTPPPHGPIGKLAKAVCDIENHPFKSRLTKPVAEMFDTLGRRSSFVYRLIFANLWCFMPVLDAICKKSGGELNAMVRTSCVFTQAEGGAANNVIPPYSSVAANLRIIGGETVASTLEYLKATVNNPEISFTPLDQNDPSPDSETDGEAWEKLTAAIAETWPDALVSPYLMMACSDSRHYCRISKHVYRFSAMALTKEERGMIHGNNERIPTDKIIKTVQFYYRLMKNC